MRGPLCEEGEHFRLILVGELYATASASLRLSVSPASKALCVRLYLTGASCCFALGVHKVAPRFGLRV
jgi:hypothetical protein